jgi:hypothetical protein
LYDHNLVINVKISTGLLNTDQTPGGFWITHPDNYFRNNAVAGSEAYGFWFDLMEHSMGPSYDPNVCPEFSKLGEFRDNSAHSVRKYGLRIHHAHVPREKPCEESPYDFRHRESGHDDPYWQNPKVPATYERFTGWMCGHTGAITERTGAVTFKDFKIADCGDSCIEFSEIEDVKDGYAKVEGATIIGKTGLNEDTSLQVPGRKTRTTRGIVGPRTEFFTVESATFFNFIGDSYAALGACSKCWHEAATDSGGRTMTVKNLEF